MQVTSYYYQNNRVNNSIKNFKGGINPQVHLISDTKEIVDILYTAARNCTSADKPYEIFLDAKILPAEKKIELIQRVIDSGHTQVLEHANLTFTISNISRVCAQMLKSYRHSTTTQKSQRYAKKGFDYIVPDAIQNNPELREKVEQFMQMSKTLYDTLISKGVKQEDARYVYTIGTTSDTVTTMNLRELMLVERERLCNRAQKEIQKVATSCREAVIEKLPWLEKSLRPNCATTGCREARSCGRPWTK